MTETTQDPHTLPDDADRDCLVAERVLGFHVERDAPEWYQRPGQPPREVMLFYRPGHELVAYSWDAHSSNACMYRNGEDESDGIAPPLPSYSDDIAAAWEVVEAMQEGGWNAELLRSWDGYAAAFDNMARTARVSIDPREGGMPLAICRAALAAVSQATPDARHASGPGGGR